MILELPYTLTIDGKEREILPDFRDVLNIISAFSDPELGTTERNIITLNNLYVDDWQTFGNVNEALEKAIWFIDGGKTHKDKEPSPRLMDWEQDFPILIAPINRVAGKEIRDTDFLHWWTFLGYYQEIGECTFSHIVGLRKKLKRGTKLDKQDREYIKENRDIVILHNRLSEDEQAQEDEFFYGG